MRLPDRQRSRAVLIGTGRYADDKLPDLPVVGRTIADLAAALTDPVYGVVPENHCTVLEDQGDIRLIGRHLRSAARSAEDLLLVYFVGHGLVGGRRHELYLGLPDSEWAEPEFNSLEYDKLRSSVLDSAAATKIIILDCCFSGRVVSETMADPVTEMVGQIEVDGTYVLTSAGRDQVALMLPGEDYTAFTGRFLHILRNGVPGGPELLTVDYLYRQLVMRMRAEGLSQPQKRGTSTADLLALAENRALAAARLAPPIPVPPELVLSDTVIDLGLLPQHGQSPEHRVQLSNAGGGDLNARAAPSARWLKLRQVGDELVVAADTSAPGEYEGTVTVDSDGGTAAIRVLAHVDPVPPLYEPESAEGLSSPGSGHLCNGTKSAVKASTKSR